MASECPSTTELRAMIDDALPPTAQAAVVAHLDGCEVCRAKMEQMAVGATGLLRAARTAIAQPGPDETSAYWPALDRTEKAIDDARTSTDPELNETRMDASGETTRARPANEFDFLDSSDRDGHIGRLDRFDIVEMVGRGGMGIVFRATDSVLNRTVAVKVLDPQYARNELAHGRFGREARAAAGVAHENVVTIHHVECATSRGLSYMVMQYVRGWSLQDRLDHEGALPVREAVRIAAATAAGLAAAHETHLIHRDIKPGNILLEKSTGRVLLTDFGLARLDEDVKLTQTGFVAGTPLYMSPEQARGEPVDHRSDLFSLGGVLYTMLAGVPPFQGSSAFTVLKKVTDERAPAIQDINQQVPSALAAIVDRLLEKDPKHRYSSAAEVAEVLRAELVKLPDVAVSTVLRASSGTWPYRARSLWRRHGLAALGGAGFVVLLVVLAELLGGTHLLGRGRIPTGAVSAVGDPVDEPTLPTRFTLTPGDGAVWGVAFSPKDDMLATATEAGSVKFWDARDGSIRGVLPARYKSPAWGIAFTPNGDRLAVASDDGHVRVWDVRTKEETGVDFTHPFAVRCLALSPDGQRLATGTRNGAVTVWNMETGKREMVTAGHESGVVMAVAFSPNGKLIASCGSDKTVRIWDAADGSPRASLASHTGPVYSVAFDPKSESLASAGWDHTIRIWDLKTSQQRKSIELHKDDVWALQFGPSGKHLLSGGQDRTARWIDIETGEALYVLRGHDGPVHGVTVSGDGKSLVSGSRDGTVRVWALPEP